MVASWLTDGEQGWRELFAKFFVVHPHVTLYIPSPESLLILLKGFKTMNFNQQFQFYRNWNMQDLDWLQMFSCLNDISWNNISASKHFKCIPFQKLSALSNIYVSCLEKGSYIQHKPIKVEQPGPQFTEPFRFQNGTICKDTRTHMYICIEDSRGAELGKESRYQTWKAKAEM